jgi:hypothetical protein
LDGRGEEGGFDLGRLALAAPAVGKEGRKEKIGEGRRRVLFFFFFFLLDWNIKFFSVLVFCFFFKDWKKFLKERFSWKEQSFKFR